MSKRLIAIATFVFLIIVLVIPSIVLGRGRGTDNTVSATSNKPNQNYQGKVPVFKNVSVHDPSIVKDKDSNEYYVFGSHIVAAKSKDLMSWTQFTNGYTTPDNKIFGDLEKNLAGSFAWAGNHDGDSKNGYAVWAPDVFWDKSYVNKDGTKGAYLMYYSTSSTYKRSAIGYAVSKNIEGPYKYVNTVVYSGFTSMDNYDGKSGTGAITLNSTPTNYSHINTNYKNTNIQKLIDNGTLKGTSSNWFSTFGGYNTMTSPNAIDPALFYDKNGKLWMSYGSWSGGIFMLNIDKNTGEPNYPGKDGTSTGGNSIDRYFGTKISGGFGKSGEGSYIIYDHTTGYYYLYESYGWLGATGGYNMRVFRSKNPDGPYVDAEGQNAVLPGKTDNSPYGEKLMGNFLFERKVGDPGTGIGFGYVSPGGNSVYYDSKTGKRFLVFHTRFPQKGEYFELRVHQIFMNKNGWPVVSPYPYSGEAAHKVNRQDVIGDYKFINHGKGTTATIKNSVYIHLNKDNKITGDVKGTWKKTSHNQVEITVNGVSYDGVFVREWNPTSKRYTMTFTAVSKKGITVWGSQLLHKTDKDIVNDVYNDLSLGDTQHVTSDITLPTEGTRHSTISWKTSDSNVVSDTGKIKRPDAGSKSVTATLTATITKGNISKTKSFAITVLPYEKAELVARYAFDDNLKDSVGQYGPGSVIGDKVDKQGGSITYAQGKLNKAAVFDGASGVRLPNGIISSDHYSVALWLNPKQLTKFTTTFFGAKDTNNWVSLVPKGPVDGNTEVWSGSTSWYDSNVGMTIPTDQWTHIAFTVDNGIINVYVNGIKKYTGKNFPNIFSGANATFSLGVNYWDPPFKGLMDDLRIYDGVLSPKQVTHLAQPNQ